MGVVSAPVLPDVAVLIRAGDKVLALIELPADEVVVASNSSPRITSGRGTFVVDELADIGEITRAPASEKLELGGMIIRPPSALRLMVVYVPRYVQVIVYSAAEIHSQPSISHNVADIRERAVASTP